MNENQEKFLRELDADDLVSERVAAERFPLSDRELEIIIRLGG